MRIKFLIPVISTMVIACNNASVSEKTAFAWPQGIATPVAEKKEKVFDVHGDHRVDEYYWINDYFKKGPDSSKVVEYLKAENAYLDTMMAQTKDFQQALFNEMKGRIKEKD